MYANMSKETRADMCHECGDDTLKTETVAEAPIQSLPRGATEDSPDGPDGPDGSDGSDGPDGPDQMMICLGATKGGPDGPDNSLPPMVS